MEQLSSKENSLIKSCRALAESAGERRKQGLVFLEGMRLCCEATDAGVPVETLLVTGEAWERWQQELLPLSRQAAHCAIVTPQLARHLSNTQSPQGVYCTCALPPVQQPDVTAGSFLLLDRLQDPGNLGSILRSAEAFGVGQLILSRDCADLWSPKVLRATMGSCFRQPTAYSDDLAATVLQLRDSGVTVYGTALDSGAITPAGMEQGSGGIGVVIGNEGAGVSPRVLDACNHRLYIPMTSRIESLNAATAAAILLWELYKLPQE